MKKNVLLKRVFAVAIAAILFTGLMITLLFSVMSGNVFTELKISELQPKARAMAGMISDYLSGTVSIDVINSMVAVKEGSESALGAYAYAVDVGKQPIFTGDVFDESALRAIDEELTVALNGQESSANCRFDALSREVMSVSTPIYSQEGSIAGALVLAVPMVESRAAGRSLTVALFIALVLVIPVISTLVYIVVGRIVKPLADITTTARRMADGDFTARANEKTRGEVGQVAKSLNRISAQLSETIYDLVVERNRLTHMLNGLSEGIVAVDKRGSITHQNPALTRLYPPGDKIKVNPKLQLIPDATVWEDFASVLKTGETVTRNIEESDRVIKLVITPIVDEIGSLAGAVGLFSDITQSERLERTRRDYVANVSHEMRTPLTAMRALIEPLKDGMVKTEEQRQRYYDIILRETFRLSRLISDLMELSRLQSGSLAIERSPMDINEVIMDLCDRYSSIAEDQGLHFKMRTDFSKCPMVYSNADRVEQLMVILLDNAIKYTQDEGNVYVEGKWDEKRAVITVGDSGIGIAKEDLPYVFDRFYKVDKAHSGKGSGLGLSIARELQKWMGEDIWVTSKAGEGSKFSFTVRLATRQDYVNEGMEMESGM